MPRICAVPDYVSSAGQEAIELAAVAGLELDPWQQFVLTESLGERRDGQWAAPAVGLVCPRQNGKNAILEARELAGLFLLGERLIVHTAHQYDTSMEAFRRLKFLIENTPDLDRRVKRYINTNGTEGIELRGGQRVRFRTRTKGGGRGFSGDCVIFDEAMIFPEASLAAILPILSARPNPQVWYTGSAVDQMVHDDGIVLARVRARGVRGDDPRLAYFEWSTDAESPATLDEERMSDPAEWAAANPALGRRITVETVEGELREFGAGRSFAVERLGVGDWPAIDGSARAVIDPAAWAALTDSQSTALNPVCLAFDVTPDRASSAIGVAGARSDDLRHLEVVEKRRGTGWLPARIAELVQAHDVIGVTCDASGPAGSLVKELEALGIKVIPVTAREHADACGQLYDGVDEARIRHLGTPDLMAAIRGAVKRPLGDAWAWSRKSSTVDISPLVAVTLALWGFENREKPKPTPRVIDLSAV